jgi:hypothetical protein
MIEHFVVLEYHMFDNLVVRMVGQDQWYPILLMKPGRFQRHASVDIGSAGQAESKAGFTPNQIIRQPGREYLSFLF